jgi:hypothetical protein
MSLQPAQPELSSSQLPPNPVSVFNLSPLIRLTLLSLYLALTVPLPFLAQATGSGIPVPLFGVGIGLGAIALYAVLTERVVLDTIGIRVTYASWVPTFFKRGWVLPWAEITALKPRSTGQGGLVYYFTSQSGLAYLLPMRVAGFSRLVQQVQAQTGIDTTDVRPLAQPWMYFTLLGLTLLLLLVDGWTVWAALGQAG